MTMDDRDREYYAQRAEAQAEGWSEGYARKGVSDDS